MRPTPANDSNFDPRTQLAALSEDEALAYAHHLIDANCAAQDADYLKAVIVAGEASLQVSLEHAIGGSSAAQLIYGTAKLLGLHTDPNKAEGLFWLRRAHNNGNGKASVLLGAAYMEGRLIGRDAVKALAYVRPAAELGQPAAQYLLANLLLDGEATPVDEERAVALLRESARQGHAPAAELLAANGIPLD